MLVNSICYCCVAMIKWSNQNKLNIYFVSWLQRDRANHEWEGEEIVRESVSTGAGAERTRGGIRCTNSKLTL